MIWGSWSAFFAMGGYGLYVWGSAGVMVVALAIEVISVRHRHCNLARHSQSNSGENDEATT